MRDQARRVRPSRMMARPMTCMEWIVALVRGPDYEGGWVQFLRNYRSRA